MVSWHSLPAELRSPIWACLQAEPREHELTNYSLVSKEWQVDFERVLFHSLEITTTDLPQFGEILQGRRRQWLRRLWFRALLPGYHWKLNRREENQVFRIA